MFDMINWKRWDEFKIWWKRPIFWKYSECAEIQHILTWSAQRDEMNSKFDKKEQFLKIFRICWNQTHFDMIQKWLHLKDFETIISKFDEREQFLTILIDFEDMNSHFPWNWTLC